MESGWDITSGDNSIVIAILDDGCDLTHPDLNFLNNGFNAGNLMNNGDAIGSHGTAVAGIAAATIDNNLGVAGVAGNCRILPIAMPNLSWLEIATGMRWAADNGANIINCSFGGYVTNNPIICLLYTSPSPRDATLSRMPSSA